MRSIPDYGNLDLSGEAKAAAERLEARAQEPASEELFRTLVRPLVTPEIRSVLELGCGTGALARRVADAAPWAEVLATDKSLGMLEVARLLAGPAGDPRLRFEGWDVLDEAAFTAGNRRFDLILSSVMVPYLDEGPAEALVGRLAGLLNPGGVLAFVEQDLMTDSVNDTTGVFLKIAGKERRNFKRTWALGLRECLKRSGLEPLPRRSFLWTDDHYGAYTRELLGRFVEAGLAKGTIALGEAERFTEEMERKAAEGEFYYGLVYHAVAGRKA